MQEIKGKLNQIRDLDSQLEIIRLDKQAAIDLVLTPEVKERLAAIDAEFDPLVEAVSSTIASLEREVKTAVLSHGATVKGAYTAVYSNGRVSWDTKALDGYAVANPEIGKFRKTGSPSVSIRRR